jgi:predicted dehydrogenase
MPTPLPASVAVVGGGRWARVLLDVLAGLLPPAVPLSAHSRSNAAGMAQWARARGLEGRLTVEDGAPSAAAVLVANLARDHERAAVAALKSGAFVFLEKPLAPDAAGAERIVAAGGRLAASQVFRWAGYVDRFARRCAQAGPLESVSVQWTAPAGEVRHGEPVRLDPALTAAADVLPHVCALVEALAGTAPTRLRSAAREGGVERLALDAGALPVDVRLQRAGSARRRLVEARAGGALLTLDFSTEPGFITGPGGEQEEADPSWSTRPRPLAAMLGAFLAWAGGGPKDPRLEPAAQLQACRLADEAGRRFAR